MMKKFGLIVWALLAAGALSAQPISIAAARMAPEGSVVTVRGIVTNGDELGKIRYLQDGTAGIAAYPGSGSVPGFEAAVQPGDLIEVTGVLDDFQNLLEISPITAYEIISSGNPLPEPHDITLDEFSNAYESQLVRLQCLSFAAGGSLFGGSGTYAVNDINGAEGRVYLRNESPLQGTQIPDVPVRITGILSQYFSYQLLPRYTDDLTPAACLYLPAPIRQENIQPYGFDLSWATNQPASCVLYYAAPGSSPDSMVFIQENVAHAAMLTGLSPGTVYEVVVRAVHNGDTIWSAPRYFATESLSSGRIEVYFSHASEAAAGGGIQPDGVGYQAILDAIMARIDSATQQIDVSLYNNNRIDITNRLKLAHARGVRIRYVGAMDTQNAALDPPPPFPVVYGNSGGLMHNKFMVIDPDDAEKAWVMSGSANWTSGNLVNDINNVLFIQDQSLARCYQMEFEEMWGATGDQPNLSNARFGSAKQDNTPHHFIIGGRPVSCWFSPSDQVTQQINQALSSADYQLSFALFSFTKDETGATVADRFFQGVEVQGLIENTNDLGCEIDYLAAQGIPVYDHTPSGSLHHKYGVVDALYPDSAPMVVTGSHNWSQAAESINDENTLIIEDADIARLYHAEFTARWLESVSTGTTEAQVPACRIVPNPVVDRFTLTCRDAAPEAVRMEIWSIDGRLVRQLQGVRHEPVYLPDLPEGHYILKIIDPHGVSALPFQAVSP